MHLYKVMIVICLLPLLVFSDNKYNKKLNEEYSKKDYKKYEGIKQREYDAKKKYQDEKRLQNDDHSDRVNFQEDPKIDMRHLHKPFRMSKLNVLWSKAQVRLTEPKLKSLYSELKVHDKEEISHKQLRAGGYDKDGLKEAELRKKLLAIMESYGLLEHFQEMESKKIKSKDFQEGDKHLNRGLFKDKKLNKLWEKAETSGFTAQELQVLKEEFSHHQDKVDQYYSVLSDVESGDKNHVLNSIDEKHIKFNEIDQTEQDPITNEYLNKVNSLRDKHQDIRDDYDRLYRMTMTGPNSKEFLEPKVQGLWKLALAANFVPEELESIKEELHHYQKRLLKLRHLHADAALEEERKNSRGIADSAPIDVVQADMIKRQAVKVAKIHLDIESRIRGRHTEL